MKSTAILINTCRGPVVDEDALYDALISDRIRGAGLDVMIEKPPAPEHKLFSLPNIILTPHMAGPSWENWKKAFRNSFDNIERVARGEKPLWVIPELRADPPIQITFASLPLTLLRRLDPGIRGLALDPNLADAHLGLARALVVQWDFGWVCARTVSLKLDSLIRRRNMKA
jgi:hypothetical protein